MKQSANVDAAVSQLKSIYEKAKTGDQTLINLVNARDEVLARYRVTFDPANLEKLTEEDFRQFLHFKNNRHWVSLQRMGPSICADMNRLRKALAILLDESRSIEDRLDQLVPQRGHAFVPRLGKAVLTPILMICHPDRYGVWNQTSEAGMKALDLWPDFQRGEAFGSRYARINARLNELAPKVGVDLWALDALWWRVLSPFEHEEATSDAGDPDDALAHHFGLERHLHDFLRDNWEHTSLGKEWKLYEEDGDPEAGYEYPCSVGRIDLLAKHRREPRWLVIELKRSQSSDQTVGQLLRYMGWVKANLAESGEAVEGLVIARESDESIMYALSAVPGVRLQLYQVEFRLQSPK